jgi:two-component system LytT family sensor kinase
MRRREITQTLGTGAALVGVWFGFFLLDTATSRTLWPANAAPFAQTFWIDLLLGGLWALLSVSVALWHKRLRTLTSNVWVLFACHVPTLIAVGLIDTEVSQYISIHWQGAKSPIPFTALLVFYSDFDVVSYLAIIAVAETLLVRAAIAERQRLAKRLEASLSRARLDYLEAQLQPHFLFNSLGAVSELAYDAPATASRVLRQLIAIFRTALARKSDEVTVGEEIVGIEPYLDIQRIRFADWLTIEYQVDDAAVECLLPRFILQPLVENAIRHGLSGRTSAGRIDISANVHEDSLIVRVADNGVGFERAPVSSGRGIGLSNVRDRLAILYGDDDRLRLTTSDLGGTVAELRIPARRRDGVIAATIDDTAVQYRGRQSEVRPLRIPAIFRRPIVAIGVVWFVCGLGWTQQSIVYDTMRHREVGSFWTVATHDMTSALIWALLTPILLWIARMFPVRRSNIAPRIVAYLLGSVATTFVHVAFWRGLASPEVPLNSTIWRMTFIVDFVIFWLLVAVGHRRVLSTWLRSREADAAALGAELAAAQIRAAKLQAIPPVLLQSLDGIAKNVRRDPSLTERQLTRLGDYLRLALECTDSRGITPERERALDAAVAALRDSGAYSHDFTLSA